MTVRKKLLIVTTTPEMLETILNGQPAWLAQHFQVALCSSEPARLAALADKEGVPTHHVPLVRGIHPWKDLIALIAMTRLLYRLRPDIVHSYSPKAGLVTMLAAWLTGVPVRIHTFTGLIFPASTGLKALLLRLLDTLVCKLATKVAAESEGVRVELLEHGVSARDVDIVGHGNIAGVDTGFFDRAGVCPEDPPLIRGKSTGAFTFCYIGRLNRDKGLEQLVDAFQRFTEGAVLLVVGALDETNPPPAGVLAAMEADPRIHMLGFKKDIRPYLLLSDVLVLPSYREGFPNVVLQALAMQVPVISTDVHGATEVVIPSHTGWLVPRRDTDSLYQAMRTAACMDSEARLAMGKHARALVSARFERGVFLDKLLQFYLQA